jgi:hypothetical protein
MKMVGFVFIEMAALGEQGRQSHALLSVSGLAPSLDVARDSSGDGDRNWVREHQVSLA